MFRKISKVKTQEEFDSVNEVEIFFRTPILKAVIEFGRKDLQIIFDKKLTNKL